MHSISNKCKRIRTGHNDIFNSLFVSDVSSTQFHLPGTILHLYQNEYRQWELSPMDESELQVLSFSGRWFHDHWIFKVRVICHCDV